MSVHDGDTLRAIDASKTEHKVRLLGIDAPEIGQPFGTMSRDRLTSLTKGKSVEVFFDERDRYGRVLARSRLSMRAMFLSPWFLTKVQPGATEQSPI